MNLDEVVNTLGIEDGAETLRPDWELSQRRMPEGELVFLSEDFIRRVCEQVFLPKEIVEAILHAADVIRPNPSLNALAWYCHYCLFQSEERPAFARQWPELTTALGRDAGLFNVLVLLSGTPQLEEFYRRRNIPFEVFRDTVLYLKLRLEGDDCRMDFGGHWGIRPSLLGWTREYWVGNVLRVGRLTYAFGNSLAKLRVFRHRTKGTVVALSEPGIRYRFDGQVDGAGGVSDSSGAWTSELNNTDTEIAGHPIDPRGHAMPQQISLARNEWHQELAPGDPIIELHMASGSPLAHDECGESLRQAMDFFPRHFSDRPFVGFTCYSWLLDAQFETLLPSTSNLVRFQKEVYLFPVRGGNGATFEAVFGRNMIDITKAPRETTMQRAFARHIEDGGHFRDGGCFLLPSEVSEWGSQFYRSQAALPFQSQQGT